MILLDAARLDEGCRAPSWGSTVRSSRVAPSHRVDPRLWRRFNDGHWTRRATYFNLPVINVTSTSLA